MYQLASSFIYYATGLTRFWLVRYFVVCTSADVNVTISAPDDPVDANSSIHLVCTALGNPALSISWTSGDTTFSNCTSERVNLLHVIILCVD